MSSKQLVGRTAAEYFWGKFGGRLQSEGTANASSLVLGLGSGSTVVAFWQELVQLFRNRNIGPSPKVIVIPTSMQSRDLVLSLDPSLFIIGDVEQFPRIDFLVDGFDRIDKQGNMIKGGGAAHVLEKLVALHSEHSLYIGTMDKFCHVLGHEHQESIPIEVLPCASTYVERSLQALGGTCARRVSKGGKMGPVVSDNGNIILDWTTPPNFPLWEDPQQLDQRICGLPGVLGSGIFVGLCSKALMVDEAGEMHTIDS